MTKKVLALASSIISIKQSIKALENQLTDLTSQLMDEMTSDAIDGKSIQVDNWNIAYIPEQYVARFDTVKFKSERPELYKRYQAESLRKATLQLKELKSK